MMGILIKSLWFTLSLLPRSMLEKFTEGLAFLFISFPSPRRRILFSNLKHAFPGWSHEKLLAVARNSSARMFEMGVLSIVYPFMSIDELRQTLVYDEETEEMLSKLRNSRHPVLLLLPHVCLLESLVTSPFVRPQGGKTLGAIYRPNKNPELDAWINRARMKTGMKTFARKQGLLKARDHLRQGNWLVVLFDQNAGINGKKGFFLDRLCSISPLPDLLAKTPDVKCVYALTKRKGFFQSQLELMEIPNEPGRLSQRAHALLEQTIRTCPSGFPEWLWSHGKWKTNDMPHEYFHLQHKRKDSLPQEGIPRKTKIWVRMPNWLGDVVMAIPLIRAIRSGRPDAEISLLCKPQYQEFLETLEISDQVRSLPGSKGLRYYLDVLKWRKEFPDAILVLTNSLRGDLESYLLGVQKRFGMILEKSRPFLNVTWEVPKELKQAHQVHIWDELLRKFGMIGELDLSPIRVAPKPRKDKSIHIGIAPGSLNSPQKRLPVDHWVRIVSFLNRKYPQTKILIFGSQAESSLCSEIFAKVDNEKCRNLSGSTSILELSEHFRNLKLLVCNDSGAMHLANALGTPIFAVFGATSKKKTGPIFEADTKVHEVGNGDLQNLPNSQAEKMILEIEEFHEGLE